MEKIKRIEDLLKKARDGQLKAFKSASHTEYACFTRAIEFLESAVHILKDPAPDVEWMENKIENQTNENRIAMLQYDSLRKNFEKMVDDVLGTDYYNMGMDVYECDRLCCEDITRKAKGCRWSLFGR